MKKLHSLARRARIEANLKAGHPATGLPRELDANEQMPMSLAIRDHGLLAPRSEVVHFFTSGCAMIAVLLSGDANVARRGKTSLRRIRNRLP